MIEHLRSKIPFDIVLNSKNSVVRMQFYDRSYFPESLHYFMQFIIFKCKLD
jgi:hypothetical protein